MKKLSLLITGFGTAMLLGLTACSNSDNSASTDKSTAMPSEQNITTPNEQSISTPAETTISGTISPSTPDTDNAMPASEAPKPIDNN